MSEFKGTKGPWTVGDEGTTARVVSDTGLVCEIGFGWDEDADSRAISDARLIAAAPDLLEALELCVDILLDQSTGSIGHGYALQGRAAIKKALQS